MIPPIIKKTNLHAALPLFIAFYVPFIFIGRWFDRVDGSQPYEVLVCKIGILTVIAMLCAYLRVSRSINPMLNPGYLFFLATSPWTNDKPLPNGPITLSYLDLAVLLPATFLAYLNMPDLALVPALVFFAVYIVTMTISLFYVQQYFVLVPLAFILPLAAYPLESVNFAMLVVLVMYLVVLFAFNHWKSNFPQNTIYWKTDFVDELTKSAVRQKIVSYPYNLLSDFINTYPITLFQSIVAGLLATWYIHVIGNIFDCGWAHLVLCICGMILSLQRILLYKVYYPPPISLFGRIFNGYFIIPGYDVVWIAPICALLSACLLPMLLCIISVPQLLSIEISCFTATMCLLAMPPSLKDWRLTGHHRITKPVVPKQRVK